MRHVHVAGMHGMGDCIHQRALIRHLMKDSVVWLETPWPCIYHDLVGERLKLRCRGSKLRTQAKNFRRQSSAYTSETFPAGTAHLSVHYPPELVRSEGSVLKAMLAAAGLKHAEPDFRLPVPQAWVDLAKDWLSKWDWDGKPIMVMRPLVERSEWGGAAPRNPDVAAYAELFNAIRDRFFVVSLADLEHGKEWTVGPVLDADINAHRGQLTFEAMAGLVSLSALTFSAPGFMPILAQAVGTPSVAVFGGYEDGRSFSTGARYASHLTLEPINPCTCFSHEHPCDKRMDVPGQMKRLLTFVEEHHARSVHG